MRVAEQAPRVSAAPRATIVLHASRYRLRARQNGIRYWSHARKRARNCGDVVG
jgi:hypothetical protein